MAGNSVPEVTTKKKCINFRSPPNICEKIIEIGRIDFEKSHAQNLEKKIITRSRY